MTLQAYQSNHLYGRYLYLASSDYSAIQIEEITRAGTKYERINAGIRSFGSIWGAFLSLFGCVCKVKVGNETFYLDKAELFKFIFNWTLAIRKIS